MGELTEAEFKRLLEEKARHKELMSKLTELIGVVMDKEFSPQETTLDLSSLEKTLSMIQQPDYSDIPTSIKAMGDALIKSINKMQRKEVTWEHEIVRDSQGLTKTIISKPLKK